MSEVTTNLPIFRRDRVADGVTTYLRDLILTGQLRSGAHLRVEHLASQLSISITPIRESLLELLSEGYVERIAHRGYVVAEITRAGFADEVLVLAMITSELAGRAAEKISSGDLAQLTSLQKEIQAADASDDRASADALNHRFHSLINKAADSAKLAWLAQRHSHYVPRSTFETLDGHPAVCTHEHRKILAALRRHDSAAARTAMKTHLIDSGKILADLLASRGYWK